MTFNYKNKTEFFFTVIVFLKVVNFYRTFDNISGKHIDLLLHFTVQKN